MISAGNVYGSVVIHGSDGMGGASTLFLSIDGSKELRRLLKEAERRAKKHPTATDIQRSDFVKRQREDTDHD